MRKALAGSLNIPAVKTLYLAGINNVLDYAEKFGYTTFSDRSRFGLSLVLGGGEIKLLEHTAAYAAYAREGIYHKPMAILKIEDAEGNILYEYKNEKDNPGQQVMPAEPIRSLTSILTDNESRAFIFGEKNYLTLPDRPVAAKTGTTNDYHDAWTLGYTPSIAAGVWVGNSDNAEMKKGADGSVVAAPIWNQFMKSILTNTPVENFNPPPENTAEKPVLRGELSGMQPVKIDKNTGKLATEFTPADSIIEKVYNQFHCILYYVNKDDPRGPVPSDPFADPQYPSWEDAVQAWAQRQGYTQSTEHPPTEYDDIHTAANQPSLEILSPRNGDTISHNNLIVTISTRANRGVRRSEYYIDDASIGTNYSEPWNLNTSIDDITSGIHTLTVKVFDDVGNNTSKSIDLNFLLSNSEGTINLSWVNPTNNSTIATNVFPYYLQAKINSPSKVQKVDFIYSELNGNNPKTIGSLNRPTNANLDISWQTAPKPGDYKLYAMVFRTNGKILRSEEIKITIK
jgi:membrane carboxypeptidase/penicillin-binding protein PbpC